MKSLIRDQPVGEYYSNEKKNAFKFQKFHNTGTCIVFICQKQLHFRNSIRLIQMNNIIWQLANINIKSSDSPLFLKLVFVFETCILEYTTSLFLLKCIIRQTHSLVPTPSWLGGS